MKRRLTFVDPLEGEIENFPLDRLLRRIRESDPAYWNSGGGGGLLYYGPVDANVTLEIYLVPGEGFHLVYAAGDDPPCAAARAEPPPGPAQRTIRVGGDPMRISRRQCLAAEPAEAVVRHFGEHGTMAPEVEWLPQE